MSTSYQPCLVLSIMLSIIDDVDSDAFVAFRNVESIVSEDFIIIHYLQFKLNSILLLCVVVQFVNLQGLAIALGYFISIFELRSRTDRLQLCLVDFTEHSLLFLCNLLEPDPT